MNRIKFKSWYYALALVLIISSTIFYIIQIAIFHKSEDTFFYLLQDLSFVPIQVLLVTLILDKLLKRREKNSFLNKLNMVIGVFFNDIGNELITLIGYFSVDFTKISSQLQISVAWKDIDFNDKMKEFSLGIEDIILKNEGLEALKQFFSSKKKGLLAMLSNPNLLEHDTFTDLLWAVFHLADELMHRKNFNNLPDTDQNHLKGDMLRAYKLIVSEWLSYMKHLKKSYPYLYSIAVRTNPFNPEADVTVQ